MTRRQVRVTYLLAMLIAVVGISAVVMSNRRAVSAPIEVGVIVPAPIEADTSSMSTPSKSAAKKKRVPAPADTVDHRDSPLYHATPRDDLR